MSIGRFAASGSFVASSRAFVPANRMALSAKSQSAPQFGGGLSAAPAKAGRLLEKLDFTAVGASPVAQIGLIFSSLIAWRLLAANERRRASVSKRWNELRENLMRDLLGFAFWFLGVPVLQRLYLAAVSHRNPRLKGVLIQHVKAESQKPKGLLQWISAWNPLTNRYIPSSQQVKDQMRLALQSLEKAGLGKNHPAYRQTQADYLRLVKHRNFATALGLGSTILLLGVGINLLNFYLTRKNMATDSPTASQPGPISPVNPFGLSGMATQLPMVNPSPFARPFPKVPANAFPWHPVAFNPQGSYRPPVASPFGNA